MKKYILTLLLLLMITMQAQATFTGQDYIDGKTYLGSGNKLLDPLYLYIVDAQGADTVGKPFFYYIPGTAPATIEGYLYYSASLDALVLRTASGWETLEAGGNFASLDEAYNGGAAIDVDSGAVTMTAGNADDNVVLAIVQSDTGTTIAMTFTNAGTGNTIDIQGSGGDDIEGTDDTWTVSSAGLAAFVGLTVGAEDIELENGGEIQNVVDTELRFMENSEDIILDFTNNGITTKSGTGVVAINWGDVDAFTGLASLAGDAGADFDIGATNTGTFNLVIAQAGTGDNELRLTSAGTAANAIALTTATGGQTFTSATSINGTAAAGVIKWESTGGDITLDATDKSVIIDGGEAVTDAINIDSATGGLDVDVALSISLKSTENTVDAIEIVATVGGIDITAIGASAGEDIDIIATGSSVNITSTENNAAAIVITENGGSSGGINIFADQGAGVSATTEHDASVQLHSDAGGIGLYTTANLGNTIRIETNGGVDENIFVSSVQGTGTDSITLTSTLGGIAVTANAAGKDVVVSSVLGSIYLKAEENVADAILLEVDGINSSTLRLYAATGTSVAEDGASIQLSSIVGGIGIQSDANLDDAIVIRADGGTSAEITIHNDQGTATDSIEFISDDGGIVLTAGKPVVVTNAFELALVLVPDGAAYTVLAANSGHTHLIPDQGATITLDLPAEVDGMRYRFVHVGGAEDAQNWIIDTENNANFYIGGIVQHDPDNGGDDTTTYYSDGSDDSILTIVTPGTGTDIEIWCDGTNWYVTGTVISTTDTGVTFTNL